MQASANLGGLGAGTLSKSGLLCDLCVFFAIFAIKGFFCLCAAGSLPSKAFNPKDRREKHAKIAKEDHYVF